MASTALYASGIYGAIGSGDLKQMESVAAAAEQHLKEHGDVGASLAALKAEIAKHKAGKH